jgi:flagellar basal-body rod protein FlgB
MDRIFGVHAAALVLRGRRASVLASNLANADTPGYKAMDFDFGQTLRQVAGSDRRVDRPARAAAADGLLPDRLRLQYRVPHQPSLDGNTVEAEQEQARFAENAIGFQASLMFVNRKIRGLMNALGGGQR